MGATHSLTYSSQGPVNSFGDKDEEAGGGRLYLLLIHLLYLSKWGKCNTQKSKYSLSQNLAINKKFSLTQCDFNLKNSVLTHNSQSLQILLLPPGLMFTPFFLSSPLPTHVHLPQDNNYKLYFKKYPIFCIYQH